jgi:hypothetical protein
MKMYRIGSSVVYPERTLKHWSEQRDYDGSNFVGRSSRCPGVYEHLYRSSKGQYYIVHIDNINHKDWAECISPEEAARWLALNEFEVPKSLRKATNGG